MRVEGVEGEQVSDQPAMLFSQTLEIHISISASLKYKYECLIDSSTVTARGWIEH